jgi:hypothetical protein
VTVPHVPACTDTPLDHSLTRLPSKKSEGDMPQFAMVTGQCDMFECLMRKIGIDDSEFTDTNGNGKVHLVQGFFGSALSSSTTDAQTFWSDAQRLLKYDVVINACECLEHAEEKPQSTIDNLVGYANAGGRLFNTHYQYFWIDPNVVSSETSPWIPSGDWHHNDIGGIDGRVDYSVDDSFPKGKAFSEWLVNVGASTTPGKVPITQSRFNAYSVNAPALRWIYGNIGTSTTLHTIQHLTFNTPWGTTSDKQCGKVLYSDFHVSGSNTSNGAMFPTECDRSITSCESANCDMTPQEKALEFMLFDLSACVQDDTKPPSPLR